MRAEISPLSPYAVAFKTDLGDESAQVIFEKNVADFEVNKISHLESEINLIQEIKMVPVEQKFKESNAIKQG